MRGTSRIAGMSWFAFGAALGARADAATDCPALLSEQVVIRRAGKPVEQSFAFTSTKAGVHTSSLTKIRHAGDRVSCPK